MGLTYSTTSSVYVPEDNIIENEEHNRSSNDISESESDSKMKEEGKIINRTKSDNYDHGKALFLLQQIIDSQHSNIEDLIQQNKMLSESLERYKRLYFEQSAELMKHKQFENNQTNINSIDH